MNEDLLPPASVAPGPARDRPWTLQLPEPRNLWIRYRPRRWPAGGAPFLDLAGGLFAADSWGAGATALPELGLSGLDDVVYVPHVDPPHHEARRELADQVLGAGLAVVLQVAPGDDGVTDWRERAPAPRGERALLVVDLTRQLLGERIADGVLDGVAGAVVAVPMLPGLLDAERFAGLAAALARHRARAVHLVAVAADPASRRRLAAQLTREEDYRALFHAPSLDERELSRIAVDQGLAVSVPRPLPSAPRRLRGHRFLAGLLAEAGDLWTRLDPSGRDAAPFFRAARFVDESPHDLVGLARDGNLRVLEWLEPGPRELVEEALRERRSRLVEELRARWVGRGAPR